jgi:predicted transcriptional regulator
MPDALPPTPVSSALAHVRDVRAVLDWLRAQERLLAGLRDEAILALVAAGMSYEAIARESGVTRGRVGQIVQGHRG